MNTEKLLQNLKIQRDILNMLIDRVLLDTPTPHLQQKFRELSKELDETLKNLQE